MEENLPREENTEITGLFGVQEQASGQGGDGFKENEVSLKPQIHGGQGETLDSEVESLLQTAALAAERTPDEPTDREAEVKLTELLKKDGDNGTQEVAGSSTAFTAISAFVAGLAVVGVVYAFAVQGTLDQYKSVVLGDSIESSK